MNKLLRWGEKPDGKTKGKNVAVDLLWNIDALSATNFDLGMKFVKKCISWLRLKNAHEQEGIFRKAGDEERLELLQKEISSKVTKDGQLDYEFSDYEDVHTISTLLKRYLRGMKEPLLTYDQYDAFIASDNFSDNDVRYQSIRFALSLIPTMNHTMLFEILFYMNEVAQYEKVNKMSARNLAIVLAPNILRNQSAKLTPMQLLTDSAHSNAIIETMIHDTKSILVTDEVFQQETAVKFRKTMRDIYHVTQRHGQKVYEKMKQESKLTDEEMDEKLRACVEQVNAGEIDADSLLGMASNKRTPSKGANHLHTHVRPALTVMFEEVEGGATNTAIANNDEKDKLNHSHGDSSAGRSLESSNPKDTATVAKTKKERPSAKPKMARYNTIGECEQDHSAEAIKSSKGEDRKEKYHTIGEGCEPLLASSDQKRARPESSRVSKNRKPVYNSMPSSVLEESDERAPLHHSTSSRALKQSQGLADVEKTNSKPDLADTADLTSSSGVVKKKDKLDSEGKNSPKVKDKADKEKDREDRDRGLSRPSKGPKEPKQKESPRSREHSPSARTSSNPREARSSRISINKDARLKRSSANLNSLLTGLSGIDVDTIMMFQISEADQQNLDDEVEMAMKEILANSVPLEEFKQLAQTG